MMDLNDLILDYAMVDVFVNFPIEYFLHFNMGFNECFRMFLIILQIK